MSRAPSEKRKLESSHASLGRLPGANQQDQHHRESRRDRANTEDQRRRCARIAQHADVFHGKPADNNAHHVHQSVAGGAQPWAHNLAKNGHIVGVKEAKADADDERDERHKRQDVLENLIDRITARLIQRADHPAGAASDPKPQVGIEVFGDYAIQIGYRVWLPTPRYFDLMYRLNLAILQALQAGGTKVAAPRVAMPA